MSKETVFKKTGPVGDPVELPSGGFAPLSQGYIAGDFLFLSGQLPFEPDGTLCAGDIELQTRLCLERLEAVLAERGFDRSSIVKATIWLTDSSEFSGFNSAYTKFFGDHRPARSTVRSDLVLPGARVEIEAIALIAPEGD